MQADTPKRRRIELIPTEEGIAAELVSIVDSMTQDGRLTDEEVDQLKQWFDDNADVTLKSSMQRLKALVAEILADGRITDQERKELHRVAEAILPPELRTVARHRRLADYEAQKEAARELRQREKDAKRKKRPLIRLNFYVAGVNHEGRGEIVLERVNVGDVVYLVRNPSNRYDSNAIEVVIETGECIGYVPRTDNSIPAKLLDSGVRQQMRSQRC